MFRKMLVVFSVIFTALIFVASCNATVDYETAATGEDKMFQDAIKLFWRLVGSEQYDSAFQILRALYLYDKGRLSVSCTKLFGKSICRSESSMPFDLWKRALINDMREKRAKIFSEKITQGRLV